MISRTDPVIPDQICPSNPYCKNKSYSIVSQYIPLSLLFSQDSALFQYKGETILSSICMLCNSIHKGV